MARCTHGHPATLNRNPVSGLCTYAGWQGSNETRCGGRFPPMGDAIVNTMQHTGTKRYHAVCDSCDWISKNGWRDERTAQQVAERHALEGCD